MKTISIRYDGPHSKGEMIIDNADGCPVKIQFTSFEVSGNYLLVFESGFTTKGRIGAIYNLMDYKIIFQ